ncbi:hypothetical protein J8I87_43455 [Paraburkholderia sp. LEh10]|uniref:hypothetical protein n=1 Tax=Paraburkholderia sp. LEh10 TaxID=2821353 RepID=UPI001AE6604D|nr:hypothetical protein [Paraburkholderia sp. LEh10]MBP0596319.1 hypothetical protein [Paraburkholderia sp. LEh10]
MIGFAFGAIPVLLLVPLLGETAAVSLEAPFMLAASWNVSHRSAKKHDMLTDTNEALLMGAIALVILTLAELCIAVLLFRRTVLEYFVGFWDQCPARSASQANFALQAFHFCRRAVTESDRAGERDCSRPGSQRRIGRTAELPCSRLLVSLKNICS